MHEGCSELKLSVFYNNKALLADCAPHIPAGGPTALFSGSLYAMTKAALNQLTKNLAVEWAADGIRVNSVAPW
jgi:NAD(P)-dependent dehydrogenase (short-subunit alcohol dehydrogenase family)